MGQSCSNYLINHDQMGKTIQFNYKNSSKYGTTLGGTVSMSIRIFIWILTILEIWHCFVVPGYTEELQFNQLDAPNEVHYTVKLDEGFPAFYIFTSGSEDDGTENSWNNPDYFEFHFTLRQKALDGTETNSTIAANTCDTVIPKYISDDYTQQQIKNEFGRKWQTFLCPDTESYELYYPTWLSWNNQDSYSFLTIDVIPKLDYANSTVNKAIYQRSGVQLLQVYPFYNPVEYKENNNKIQYGGKAYFASFFDYKETPLNALYWIRQETLTIFNNVFFDENGIKFFSLANVFTSYYSEQTNPTAITLIGHAKGQFSVAYFQSRNFAKTKWTVRSLNVVLGQLGGYTSLIWMVTMFLMSNFEAHRFRTSLVSQIYLCTPEGPNRDISETKEQSDVILKQTLGSKTVFHYPYREAWWIWLLSNCFCCFKNMQCYKRRKDRQKLFDDANKRLNQELNLHTLLNTMRQIDFITEVLNLKTHQKVLINKQRKYQVRDPGRYWRSQVEQDWSALASSEIDFAFADEHEDLATTYFEQSLLDENQRNISWLLSDFDPAANRKDEILLTGITGYKAGGTEFERSTLTDIQLLNQYNLNSSANLT